MQEYIYKSIPLENGSGEQLSVCPHCFGGGTLRKCLLDVGIPGGRVFKAGQFIDEATAKIFTKKDFKFESGDCKKCSGAGLVKSHASS